MATNKRIPLMLAMLFLVVAICAKAEAVRLPTQNAQETVQPRLMADKKHFRFMFRVAFSPDGKNTLIADKNILTLWDMRTEKILRTFSGHLGAVRSIAFSLDGKRIVSGGADGALKLWDADTGKELRTFNGDENYSVDSIALSPDGKTLFSGRVASYGNLMGLTTGKTLHTFREHAFSAAISPNGKTILTGSVVEPLTLWDMTTGIKLRIFQRSDSTGQFSLAFSPDGKTVLSGGLAGELKLWDAGTGKVLRTLGGHEDVVAGVSFLPDGKMALSGSMDGQIKLWRVSDGALLATRISFNDGNWVVYEPTGHYDSSNGGDNPYLRWMIGNKAVGRSQIKRRYHEPGLLQRVMGFEQ